MNPSAPRVRTELQVVFFDTDCGGVVSKIASRRFIEIARTFLAEELGLALAEMAQTQRYPVVVRTEIDYRRAAKLADRLVVEGWLDRVDRARFECAFRITRPKDETLIAECRQTLALIEMPAGKLLRFQEHWEKSRAATSGRCMVAGTRAFRIEETLMEPPALSPPPTRHALFVFLVTLALLLHVATVGWGDLYSETGGQYAGAAREMVESHQWLLPTNDGIPRLQKPPLLYWLIIASVKIFGVSAAATRLPISLF